MLYYIILTSMLYYSVSNFHKYQFLCLHFCNVFAILKRTLALFNVLGLLIIILIGFSNSEGLLSFSPVTCLESLGL
jgi:hypothetical protein